MRGRGRGRGEGEEEGGYQVFDIMFFFPDHKLL